MNLFVISILNISIAFLCFCATINNCFCQKWELCNAFPATERDDGTAFVIGKIAYAGSGLKKGWIAGNDFFAFDMSTETWSKIRSMPEGKERQYSAGFSNNKCGFVFGGVNKDLFFNDLWAYNIMSKEWMELESFPSFGRKGGIYFNNSSNFYYTTGINKDDLRLTETWKCSNPVGIDALYILDGIKLFPNPIEDYVNFEVLQGGLNQKYNLNLYDCLKRKLTTLPIVTGRSRIRMNDLPKGMYFVEIQSNFGSKLFRIIKN